MQQNHISADANSPRDDGDVESSSPERGTFDPQDSAYRGLPLSPSLSTSSPRAGQTSPDSTGSFVVHGEYSFSPTLDLFDTGYRSPPTDTSPERTPRPSTRSSNALEPVAGSRSSFLPRSNLLDVGYRSLTSPLDSPPCSGLTSTYVATPFQSPSPSPAHKRFQQNSNPREVEAQSRSLFELEEAEENFNGTECLPHRTRVHNPSLGIIDLRPSPPQEDPPPPYSRPTDLRNVSWHNPYMDGQDNNGINILRLARRHRYRQMTSGQGVPGESRLPAIRRQEQAYLSPRQAEHFAMRRAQTGNSVSPIEEERQPSWRQADEEAYPPTIWAMSQSEQFGTQGRIGGFTPPFGERICLGLAAPGTSACHCFGSRTLAQVLEHGDRMLALDPNMSSARRTLILSGMARNHGGIYSPQPEQNSPGHLPHSNTLGSGTIWGRPEDREQEINSHDYLSQRVASAGCPRRSESRRRAHRERPRRDRLATLIGAPISSTSRSPTLPQAACAIIDAFNNPSPGLSQNSTARTSGRCRHHVRHWDIIIQAPGRHDTEWRVHNPSGCTIRIDHPQSQVYLWGGSDGIARVSGGNRWVPLNDPDRRDPNGYTFHPDGNHRQDGNQGPPPAREGGSDLNMSQNRNSEHSQNRSSGTRDSDQSQDPDSGHNTSEKSSLEIKGTIQYSTISEPPQNDMKENVRSDSELKAKGLEHRRDIEDITATFMKKLIRLSNERPVSASALQQQTILLKRLYGLSKKPGYETLNHSQFMKDWRKAAIAGRQRKVGLTVREQVNQA